ncbi:hypothetical protein FOL47_007449 [Perkinsus chesapeaki]|uniref:Uncharacterized protein n=1 Tax=Perkinsus chesapeaki TaxID=330153 RepID=A0A7J6MWE7_PERCH|nr:hypothetical protein FOL47_007449 [Perkinsus chesapeaki]
MASVPVEDISNTLPAYSGSPTDSAAAQVTPLAPHCPLKVSVQRTSPVKESGDNVYPPPPYDGDGLSKAKSCAVIGGTPPLPKRAPVVSCCCSSSYDTPPAPPRPEAGVYMYRATEKDVNDVKLCILAYYRLKRLRGQRPTRATIDYINSLGCFCRGGGYTNNTDTPPISRTPLARVPSGGSSTVRSYTSVSPPGSPPGSGKPPRSPPRRKADDVINLSSRLSMMSNGGPSA